MRKNKPLSKNRLLVIDCPFSFWIHFAHFRFYSNRDGRDPVICTVPLTLSRLGTAVLLPVLFRLMK